MDNNTLLTPQEIERKGQEIYEQKLKEQLEKEHLGKYVAIDIETEEYFLGETLDEALTLARNKYPNKIFHSIKIGSEGVFKASGLFGTADNNEWVF